jgi:hypothetical protein
MIQKMFEEALEGNYTAFSELFKEELGKRIHERLEDMKASVIDNTYNVCESCDPEEDEEDEEEYFDVDEDDVYDEEEVEEGYTDNPVDRIEGNPYGALRPKGIGSDKKMKKMKKEAMDPVGKEDGDIDNDGDKDSSDKYLLKRRKAIAKAMKKEGSHGSKKVKSGGGY